MSKHARRIEIRGVVQGVGFRPFVYRLAHRYNLAGWVRNTSWGVEIEVEGDPEALDAFVEALSAEAPPLAVIESIAAKDIPPNEYRGFEIRHSKAQEGRYILISPDVATCDDCLRELFDPNDRRYLYPFINCTNCGPRFTIIQDIPYDRPKTTMRPFKMCPDCQREYDDPLDRRFHAQPNACPVCGPHVWLARGEGRVANCEKREEGDEPPAARSLQPEASSPLKDYPAIQEAARLLRQGYIVAVKGLGGFHLACDATSDEAVRKLRERKRRPAKPFAVMMATLEEVKSHCFVSPAEEEMLLSPQRPIVLLRWREDSTVSRLVAPRNLYLGVMLPYTPLHHILLREVGVPLVMTSGNISEEPIAKDNDEALRRLGDIADCFLLHDRDIHTRCDDSVVAVMEKVPRYQGAKVPRLRGSETPRFQGSKASGDGMPRLSSTPAPRPLHTPAPGPSAPWPLKIFFRRSRGYAPFPVKLPFPVREVLACGADLKNTFCITRDRYAFPSQHIGDLENVETMEHFRHSLGIYEKLFRFRPELIVHDLHPDYNSTRLAQELAQEKGLPLIGIQHHYAHIASCLADNGWPLDGGPVIGVALDGTGYGLDGRIWGCEFLLADYRGFRRVAHLEYLPLPGGDAAIRNPYRIAIGYLVALGLDFAPGLFPVSDTELAFIERQVERGINSPLTSSCGRLFDAVSSILGICHRIDYEAQAAIELEMEATAWDGDAGEPYPFEVEFRPGPVEGRGVPDTSGEPQGGFVIRVGKLLEAVLAERGRGTPAGRVARRFHLTVAGMVLEVCRRLRELTGIETVALSGGCFQNRLLLGMLVPLLEDAGFRVLLHRRVPPNDGGVSLGQAVIGALAKG